MISARPSGSGWVLSSSGTGALPRLSRKRASPSGSWPARRNRATPKASAFFEDTYGGSFLVDLGSAISVTKINSYAWHQHEILEEHRHRATQRFTLYGFAGDQLPDIVRPPRRAGWTRIARVNTDEYFYVAEPVSQGRASRCWRVAIMPYR